MRLYNLEIEAVEDEILMPQYNVYNAEHNFIAVFPGMVDLVCPGLQGLKKEIEGGGEDEER